MTNNNFIFFLFFLFFMSCSEKKKNFEIIVDRDFKHYEKLSFKIFIDDSLRVDKEVSNPHISNSMSYSFFSLEKGNHKIRIIVPEMKFDVQEEFKIKDKEISCRVWIYELKVAKKKETINGYWLSYEDSLVVKHTIIDTPHLDI